MWTLSTSVVPSGWFAGVFLFSVTVPCPFPSRFFGQSLSCSTGGHCWTMLISKQLVSDLSLSDCNFCRAHGPVHVDTQVAVVGSFSFACLPGNVFETKCWRRETSETPVFPNTCFCLVVFGMLLMRCRSRLGTEAVQRVLLSCSPDAA